MNNAISNALKNYVTTANLEAALATQKAEIKDELSKIFATEDSILDSIQTGKIGETIMITDEQIKSLL